MSKRPELLKLGGEPQFNEYNQHFKNQFLGTAITDVLGRRVVFRKSDCKHVCYETDEDNYDAGRRTEWSQERAERLPWILPTLTAPFEVRPNKVRNRETFLIRMEAEPEKDLLQENYCVIVERIDKATVGFVTAFPHNHKKWNEFRKEGKKLYPKD